MKKKNVQKIRENVAIGKKSAYVIYEWPLRQMFHRLCIHVIQKLRDMEKSNYLLPWIATDPHELPDEKIRPQVYYLFFYSSPKSTLLFQYSTGPPERISKWLGLIF